MFTYATQILFSLMMLSMVFAMIDHCKSLLPRESQRSYRKTTDISNPPQPGKEIRERMAASSLTMWNFAYCLQGR